MTNGIIMLNFFVNDINVPEDDPAVTKLKDALSKRAEMDIIGFNYVQERSFDTLEGAATNPGAAASGIMGAGIGLGMGAGIGSAIGQQAGGLAQSIQPAATSWCPFCNEAINTPARFCPHCGKDTTAPVTAEETTNCADCGEVYSRRYKFCPGCSSPYNPCVACGADMKIGSVACAVCGKSAPKPCRHCGVPLASDTAKFCPECGGSLLNKCGECGTIIEGTPKFCLECGNKL